jgi:hypothetical protein
MEAISTPFSSVIIMSSFFLFTSLFVFLSSILKRPVERSKSAALDGVRNDKTKQALIEVSA